MTMASSHYAGGILKQRFNSENASSVFRPHCTAAEEFENTPSNEDFGFVFEANALTEIT